MKEHTQRHCCVSAKRTRIGAAAGPARVGKPTTSTDWGPREPPISGRASRQRASLGLNAVPIELLGEHSLGGLAHESEGFVVAQVGSACHELFDPFGAELLDEHRAN